MRYVSARLKKDDEEEAYRIYTAFVLKVISGKDQIPWYHDMMSNVKTDPVDENEIKQRIKNGVNSIGGSD